MGKKVRAMTIGIDATPATRTVKTGTEHYAEALILALAAMKTEHQFVLYSRYQPTGKLAQLPANFRWKVMPFPILWSQVRLAVEFLFHPRAVDVMFFPAHVMPLIHPKRSVITLHDIGFEHLPELYASEPIGPSFPPIRWLITLGVRLFTGFRYRNNELDYHRWATRFALDHAKQVVTVSNATKRDITTHFHPSVPITVTHSGFVADRFTPLTPTTKKLVPKQIARQTPYLLFIGRLEAKKNVKTLVEAFGLVAAKNKKLQLVLIGRPGYGYADIADAIQALPADAAKRVHELGYRGDGEVRQWLQSAELFTFPSAFEGFGIPPLEAMACGVPVISANGSSLPEVVGTAAKLVDTYDVPAWASAIESMLKLAKLQADYRKRGLKHIQTFQWSATAKQTLTVLETAGANHAK